MEKIILYTTVTCAFCPAIKKVLDDAGVDYEEIDVSEDEEAFEEMKKKSGQMGVPVTVIGDDVVVGFDKKKILKLLEGNS